MLYTPLFQTCTDFFSFLCCMLTTDSSTCSTAFSSKAVGKAVPSLRLCVYHLHRGEES